MNWTFPSMLTGDYTFRETPIYYSERISLVEGVQDVYLTMAAPVIAFWALSMIFHVLDMSTDPRLDKYRIHPSSEVASRNRATRTRVVLAVIFQQFIQTLLGLWWIDDSHSVANIDHRAHIIALRESIAPWTSVLLGIEATRWLLSVSGGAVVYWIYWWGIPIAQFFTASIIIDTWQYFLHRGMHMNKFLYKHLHSVHHQLYVPYAFGALYNHPVEGFLLDSLGAALAEWMTLMTTRQAMLLFSFTTMKTVDDHCGYNFSWDPFQLISGNNANYHDIHHQSIGIKSNFAQPFFVHWDTILGTRMSREDIARRRETYKTKTT